MYELDSIHPRQLEPYSPFVQKPKRKSYFRFGLALVMLVLLAIGIFIGSKLVIFAQKVFENNGGGISFRQLFIAPDKPLQGEEQKEIRILLLGIGGEKHEGGTLTDTMILATLKLPESKTEEIKVGLLSIPRDLVVNIPGYDWRKINSAYAYGESGGRHLGPKLALETVEQVLGIDIPYYGVIDFEGSKKIIDDLGGIEINVEQGFTDSMFPDDKGGYLPPLTFEAGWQKMDGARALQYVRSRHGNNNQGSDFARAVRQQLVLKVIKEKIMSIKILTNLSLIDQLLDDLAEHLRTNLEPYELKHLYGIAKNLKSGNIQTLTIDGKSGLVCEQIQEDTSAYILLPCEGLGHYQAIQDLVKNQFLIGTLQKEQPTIEIQNSSNVSLLGQRVQNFLASPYLKIQTNNFRGQTVYLESVIYDNTQGGKPETLQYLKQKLGIRLAASPFPFLTNTPQPDFVIVVTSDLENKLP